MSTNAALRKNMQALNSRFLQHNDAAELLKEAELFKLRQQLQPHFLYNSLNSINALVMISPDKAQEMIGKLSDFLRGSVKREGEDIISVNEEIVYIESYLAIESVRFGDRLSVSFEKDYSEKATIPPFLFQPILENAIKFGLYGKTGKVQISINIKEEDNTLMLTITNPYDISYMPPKGTGFGLKGVGRRLYLLYARTDLLETSNDGQNFTTILKIPQNHV
jgi:LytS/YehU family sensor histidine kinase